MSSKKTDYLKMHDWTEADPWRLAEVSENFKKMDKKAKDLDTSMAATVSTAADAKTTATGIDAKATDALAKSTEAVQNVSTAVQKANSAETKATEAKTVSDNALAKAGTAESIANGVQTQFNQVVINGDSSVEAAQARVNTSGQTYSTLKQRLDSEHQEVTVKLAETSNLVANSTQAVNDIQLQVSNLASVKIAGSFDTLLALSTAHPNGDGSNLYVVREDGNWYYFDTSNVSWTSGGNYQARASSLSNDTYATKRYTAVVKNTLDIPYTNKVIKLYASFERGEVLSENHLLVKTSDEAIIQHQWEDDRHVNYKFDRNFGRHPDGSLKDGYILIIDSFISNEEKTYYVDAYKTIVRTPSKNVATSSTSTTYTLSTSRLSLTLDKARKYLASEIIEDGVRKWFEQDPAYNTAVGTSVRLAGSTGGITVKSAEFKGTGEIFVDFHLVLTNDLFDFHLITRMYANDTVDIKHFFKAKREILATECYGMTNRTYIKVGTDYVQGSALMVSGGWTDNTINKAFHLKFAHGDYPRDDSSRPTYPVIGRIVSSYNGDSTIKRIVAGWEYVAHSPLFNIPEGEVFVGLASVNYGGYTDSLTNEIDRYFNDLVGRLTSDTKFKLKSKVFNLIAESIRNNLPDYESNYSGGDVAFLARLAMWKIYGIGSLDSISTLYKAWMTAGYGSGDAETMWTLFKQDQIKAQRSDRIIPTAEYLLAEYRKLNNATEIAYYEKVLKSYAEMFCRIYEERGYTPLRYITYSYVTNSIAAGLRGLAMGIKLEPNNTRWTNAYVGNEQNLGKCMPVANIFTDGFNEILPITHYIHYVAYTFQNYQRASDQLGRTPIVNTLSYTFNATCAYGAMKEQEYCISSSRRGLGHTLSYVVDLMIKADNPSSLQQAINILERFDEHNKVTGGHEFPLEKWRYEPAQPYISSSPFEMNCLAETLFFLLDQKVKSNY